MATNTATSFTNHTAPGSGSTAGPYAISFSYLDQSDVDVTVNGTLQALGVKYTFTSGTQITFTSGNEPPNGAAIVIKRDTNISAKKVDFQDGAVLTETDLDTNSDQLLFGLQEFTDKINGIEDGATGDQTPADILAAIVQVDGASSGLDSDKLDGQEGSYYVDYSNLTNKHANLTALESGSINNIAIGVTTPAAGLFSSLTVDNIGANGNVISTITGPLQLSSASDGDQTTEVLENLSIAGNLTVTGNINQSGTFQLSGTNVTSSAAELNVLDGITSTTAELNILDGVTANATNINIVTGMSKQTTISDSDTAFPTSGAVVDYFAARNIGDLANVDTTGVADGKILKYQSSSNKFIIADDTAASNNAFTGLSDTPANFTGAANKTLKINAAGNAVEFVTVTTPSGNIVDDTSPQLGGNLDVNGKDIVSVSNGNIKLSPDGTGNVQITSDLIVDTTTLVVDATNNKVGIGTATPSTALEVNGTVTATTFAGSGASLTNLPAANITGTLPAISGANLTNLDAADLASGTIPSDRFAADTIATSSLAAGALPTDVTIADTNISGNLTIESADIVDGTIVNADISASAAIAKSKLASLDIVNADVNASAAIAGTKISPDFGSQDITASDLILTGTGTNTDNSLDLSYNATSGVASINADSSGGNTELQLGTSNNGSLGTKLTIKNTGEIGIGTTTPLADLTVTDSATHTAFASSVPSATDCMLQLYNNPSSETTNNHATIQLGVNGGTHNRVSSISAIAESASNRKLALAFCTDSSANRGERMRITGDGNVGIGTNSIPTGFKLAVNGDLSLGETGGSDNTFIDQKQNGMLEIINSGRDDNAAAIRINRMNNISGGTDYFRDVNIYDGKGNSVMYVDGSAASVGIGTTSPNGKLHVQTGATGTIAQFRGDSTDLLNIDGDSNQITLDARNVGALAFEMQGSEAMRIDSSGNVGIGLTPSSGQGILQLNGGLRIAGSASASDTNAPYIFRTSGADNMVLATSGTERMRIDSSGNIGAPSGSNIYNASDSRVKRNIVDLDKGLIAIKSLRPVSFNWIDGFCDEEKNTLYGFIAQEVQTVDSNLIEDFATELKINENKIENILRVNEKFIIPMLVKAIQELSAKVEALEAS